MEQFPAPIRPDESVRTERAQREKNLITASTLGVLLRCGVIFIELAGYFAFKSSVLLVDAVASLMDVASTLLLILSIRIASRPPDANHPFGHGRLEPLAGLQLSLFLIIVGGILAFQQANSLAFHETKEPLDTRAWIVPVLAVLLLEAGYQLTMRAAKKHHSPALAADAWHYRIDSMNSLIAAFVLGVGAIVPEWSVDLDFIGAMVIAVFMVGIGIHASRENLNQLMDRVPDSVFFERVRRASKRVSGVLETEKIRIQQYGPDAHVDIDIEVEPTMTVDAAHVISQQVRAEIQKDWASVRDVTVHIEPYYPGDH